MLFKIKRELRDLVSLWLVPGIAAVLPWSWCVRIFARLAHSKLLMREEVGGSRGGRVTLGFDPDDPEFDWRFRFGFLLEHADVFRALGRGWKALARTMPLERNGETGMEPGLCFFFNFNQGLAALASLRAAGFRSDMVYRGLPARPPGFGWVRYAYMHFRIRMVTAVCGKDTGIATGGAHARIIQSVAAGRLVLVAADSPPRPGTGVTPVRYPGDRQAYWRSGVLKLALDLPGPKRCIEVKVDWKTGERCVQLYEIRSTQTLGGLVAEVNGLFLDAFARQPELWFYWPAPQGFLIIPPGARVDSADARLDANDATESDSLE